jgi:hypothetical protein
MTIQTLRQFQEAKTMALVAEYGCSVSEAKEIAEGVMSYHDWWDASIAAIKAGDTPSQAWVNMVSGKGEYTAWESFLKHNPNVFDRLAKAGLSLYYTKAGRDAVAKQNNS